ncbi:MAG: L-rhamnose/proton symporter RhaT [Bacteroidales bacterium]|nr:L-rhamnose/proton symporter RhaT [Bacteroidales bacterium]
MNSLSAIGMIAIGSLGASSFYVPFRKVKKWSWESYWLSQGLAAWIIAPWLFALFSLPGGSLFDIIREAPPSAKWLAVLFGALWGVGGLTFGLSIRYLGVAMGQSIALGFCAAFGTLIPPLVAGHKLFGTREGILMVIGVAVCVSGIAVIGYAGALKNKNMTEAERRMAIKEFALKKGLLIAVFAGIMSAAFSYGYEVGQPIDLIALSYGVNPLFQSNVTLIFILIGGFITNFTYCVYLNIKNRTYKDYLSVPGGVFVNNLFFTFLAGLLWFLQFHFYGMGKSQLPAGIAVFAWSILMALNIAFSNIWGIILKEWKGAGRQTMIVLVIGIVILILSTFVINLG